MTRPAGETITDMDLQSYVDDQLDDTARAHVEAYLARHPDLAAKVMGELRLRTELRLALVLPEPDPALCSAATRLSSALRRRAVVRSLAPVFPAAAAVVLLVMSQAGLGPLSIRPGMAAEPPPPFVQAALSAHEAAMLRLAMLSQPEVDRIDAAELRARTGIVLPAFDQAWQIRDAQIFPSPQGPGIEVVLDTPDLGRLTAFAVRPGGFDVQLPRAQQQGETAVSWFRIGETAHVLVADRARTEALSAHAEALAETLY